MLRMDDQRARVGKAEFGTDRRVPEGHGRGTIRGEHTGGGLRLDRRAVVPAGVFNAGASRPRAATALYRKDGADEPGAGHAPDLPLRSQWAGGGGGEAPVPVSTALHAGRCGTAGPGR